jgi:heme/copper-type cytochrome/quinol oxidase subunit 3
MTYADVTIDSGHHESPEVITSRELVGVWLFIAGDCVILIALLFTYLYLRGLNTAQQWLPTGVHGASTLMAWLTVAVVAASAWAIWSGENAITRARPAASLQLVLATLLALVGAGLSIQAIASIPHATNATSGVGQVAGSYASTLLAIDISNLVHLVVLVFLGLGVAARTKKGLISLERPGHARLVRIFWVWVTASVTAAAITTTIFVASPK